MSKRKFTTKDLWRTLEKCGYNLFSLEGALGKDRLSLLAWLNSNAVLTPSEVRFMKALKPPRYGYSKHGGRIMRSKGGRK